MHDEAYVARCEAETARWHDKIRGLGGEPPGPIGYFRHDPHRTVASTLEFAVSEYRRAILERRGAELRAGLVEVLSIDLLAKLDAASTPDERQIEASVPVGLLRLLYELIAAPDVGEPRSRDELLIAAGIDPKAPDDDDAEPDAYDELPPIFMDDLEDERTHLDVPTTDMSLICAALGDRIDSLVGGVGDKRQVPRAAELRRVLEEQLFEMLEAEIEGLQVLGEEYRIRLPQVSPDETIASLTAIRDQCRLALTSSSRRCQQRKRQPSSGAKG